MRDFLAATRDRIVVFDGGMGATLEQFDLSLERDYRLPGRCHEALVLNRPDVIQGVHESMVEAGAEVVETDTFQASRLKLDEWGLGEHILEVKAAVFGAREAFKQTGRSVPIQTSVSLLPNGGKMLLGTDIAAVLTTLLGLDVDVIGLNCSTGPEDMRDAIRFLGENSPLPVHCIPNAGLPVQGPSGETIFPEQPEPLSATLQEFVERYGVSIVGGCCGTTPDHIGAIAERVKGRELQPRPKDAWPPHLSSMMTATPLEQEP